MPNKTLIFFLKLQFLGWKNSICTHWASDFLRRCCFILTYSGSLYWFPLPLQTTEQFWLSRWASPSSAWGGETIHQSRGPVSRTGNPKQSRWRRRRSHFFREITSSALPTVQTISIVLEIHWKMNAMTNTEKHLSFQPKDFFIFKKTTWVFHWKCMNFSNSPIH